jgi:hypothetical protein
VDERPLGTRGDPPADDGILCGVLRTDMFIFQQLH